MEHLFLDDQITVPEEFPFILKDYAKAAIRTNPNDLLEFSVRYFTALRNGEKPPVKERLAFEKPPNPYFTAVPGASAVSQQRNHIFKLTINFY
ncbi:ropporin-1-like protein [Stegodyphus dumicola]|uniref:ropporin-1-like protein n=1 Tax=Stegodyphus dumicola TaxID=202533 RepID=UPI0015AAAC52|nr:ropporin-1-like protein [Stegodyphus dumicola]